MADPPAVVLVKGPERELRTRSIDEVVDGLLGDDDRSLALAETSLPPRRGREGDEGGADARLSAIAVALDGARTPPFGTERRIVVIRTDDEYVAAEADPLAAYLEDPEPTTVLVLEAPGRVPAALAKAAKAAGLEEVGGGLGRDPAGQVLGDQLARAGLSLTADAVRLVTDRLREAAGRVPALVDLLSSTFGRGAKLEAEDVEPYLVEEGGVPVFELTKAIDAGDVPATLLVLQRMTGPMGMHPLQVTAILHNHFRRVLRLDDPAIRSEEDAVEALGGKVKPYPAKLALQKARDLGTDGIRRAMALLAKADRDLRGGTGAPDGAVLQILVTELAMLSRKGAPSRAGRPS